MMNKKFTVDARAILALGRDSIRDHTTALVELVKNSYDADATSVHVEILTKSKTPTIRVADNGHGMSEQDVDNYWLRIGYSHKRNSKLSNLKRRKTGEKGIGRLSADRLGKQLTLITKSKNENVFGLTIDWSQFDIAGKDISAIPLQVMNNPTLHVPPLTEIKANTGTELKITKLRQNWTAEDIENLYNELSLLTPPFRTVKDFEIILKNDVVPRFNRQVESAFIDTFDIEMTAQLVNDELLFSYRTKESKAKNAKPVKERVSWTQFKNQVKSVDSSGITQKPTIGEVSLRLLYVPRKPELLQDTEFSMKEFRSFLSKNSGVRIYRDNIRVKPYGNPDDPNGDWLGLAERRSKEPAAPNRPTHKIASYQLAGGVFISRDKNPSLKDSSAREGLIHDEGFAQLKIFAIGCIEHLEAFRYKRHQNQNKEKEEPISPSTNVSKLKTELSSLKKDLTTIQNKVPQKLERPVERVIDQVQTLTETIKTAEETIDELVNQNQVFRGLATIGIAATVFGHETQAIIDNFKLSTDVTRDYLELEEPEVAEALEELYKAEKFADRISLWGAFALARIQRDKRKKRKLPIHTLVRSVISEIKPVFDAVNIEIHSNDIDDVFSRTFAMDIEAVVLNLLTNAYQACQQIQNQRKVVIKLKETAHDGIVGFSLIVADSGPGVPLTIQDSIWKPLFTTKKNEQGNEIGTGLGLFIIQSIVNDFKGKRALSSDKKLKGASFEIWFPLNR